MPALNDAAESETAETRTALTETAETPETEAARDAAVPAPSVDAPAAGTPAIDEQVAVAAPVAAAEAGAAPETESVAREPGAEPGPGADEWTALPPAPAAPAGRLARAAAASLVGLALLAAVLTTVTTVKLAGDRVPCGPVGSGERLAEVAAAANDVRIILSYDYRHLDADFAAAERVLTPKFRKTYVELTNKGVKPLAAKYKAITSASVSAAGLVSTTRGSCDHVLVLAQQTVTNSQLAQPRLDRSRIEAVMVRTNGHWLVGNLVTL